MYADEEWRSERVVDDAGWDDEVDDDRIDDDDDDVGGDPDAVEPDGRGAEPPLMHDGMPIRGYYRGEPIPDLDAGRQIYFRLGPHEHARLVEAARLFAMPPTALARILTVRGVDRALHEEHGDR